MKTYIFLLLMLIGISLNAQNETINWYFGNKAALNFDRGRLEVLDNSEMNAPAGSASISNEDGLLMFYSDGASVWNRNHEIMENGNDLAGDNTNFQSAIIIPKPGTENNYYLFYARSENSTNPFFSAGTFFSEIEFSDQHPLGKVIQRNILIDSYSPSEKLTAVHHKSGESFWLVILTAANSDNEALKTVFKAFEITETGVSGNPIKTDLDKGIVNAGSMKLSVDGKKLLVSGQTTDQNTRYVYYFNFDNETGVITFKRNLLIDPPGANWPPKGIEISPNGQFVYISFIAGNNNGIFQYEIDGPGAQDDARAMIFFESNIIIESLQLANDQKIYAALSYENDDGRSLGVINNPNEKGSLTDFTTRSIALDPGASKEGLPNFVQSYFASKVVTENQCFVDPFTFSSTSYASISDVVWDFGDGNTGSGLNTTHTYTAPGEYTVQAILSVGTKKVTVYKVVEAYALPDLKGNQELIECDENTDGISIFNLNSIKSKITNSISNEELFFYVSQEDLNNDIQIENPEKFENTTPNQEIFVKVVNENGCFETTTFTVSARFVDLDNISDFFTCEDSDGIIGNGKGLFDTDFLESSIRNQLNIAASTTLAFYPTALDAQTNLNKLEDNFSYLSGTIFVKAQEADFSCGGIQSFNIVVNSEPIINIEDSYTICYDPSVKPPVIINANSSNNRFEWKDEQGKILSIEKDFVLNNVGEFSLTVYKAENGLICSNSKTFKVINPPIPVFNTINVNTEDETNNIVDVTINGNSTYEFSLDNINFSGSSTFFTFTNVAAGLRTIYVRDIDNCEQPIQINVSVIGFREFFTPNGDGENDYWNVKGIDAAAFKAIDVQIYDRYGKIVHTIRDFKSLGWNGTYNGKNLPANNYWFKAKIIDKDDNVVNRTGNFSLIRT